MNYLELYEGTSWLQTQQSAISTIQSVHTPEPEYHSHEELREALLLKVKHLPIVQRPAPAEVRAVIATAEPHRSNVPAEARAIASAERVKILAPKPTRVKRGYIRRASIIRRDPSECNHMHEGNPCWNKDGKAHGVQRYKCPACGTRASERDGKIAPISMETRKHYSADPAKSALRSVCPHEDWVKDGTQKSTGRARKRCKACGVTAYADMYVPGAKVAA